MTRSTESNGRHQEAGPWRGETHRAMEVRHEAEDKARVEKAIAAGEVPVVRLVQQGVVLAKHEVNRLGGHDEVTVSWQEMRDAAQQDDQRLRGLYARALDVANALTSRR